jgi:hypothetical protein
MEIEANFKNKIDRFNHMVAEKTPQVGVLKFFAIFGDPPLLKLLRGFGFRMKPLFYWHPIAKFLFVLIQLGLFFSLMIWILFWGDMTSGHMNFDHALINGYALAFIAQLIGTPIDYVVRKRYQMPNWNDL